MLTGNSGTIVAAVVAIILNIVFNFKEIFRKENKVKGELNNGENIN
ncbi:hypothetical protein [endosymbiont 'TC1' of Trimyema compressum]|nr:hypothetical protein [endosymbiont 'TC1' of Trimyema compressum]